MKHANVKARQVAVAVDFGGTSLKLGLVDREGQIITSLSVATGSAPGPEGWLDAVSDGIDRMLSTSGVQRKQLKGIGVGAPGFTDYEDGYIHTLPNVPGWDGVPLGNLIRKRFGLAARVDNDVNAMALGECTYGAGRDIEHAIFLTLGTGVGGGLLINNRIYRGAHSMAGEIGHLCIQMKGVKSSTGRGGLEQYIGNSKIIKRAVTELKKGRRSAIAGLVDGDLDKVTPREIAQAAKAGDELGIEIFDFVAECLATALASVTYLIQPQSFIIGGGVAQSGSVLFTPLKRHLKERLHPLFYSQLKIQRAKLGNNAGMAGCGAMILESNT